MSRSPSKDSAPEFLGEFPHSEFLPQDKPDNQIRFLMHSHMIPAPDLIVFFHGDIIADEDLHRAIFFLRRPGSQL